MVRAAKLGHIKAPAQPKGIRQPERPSSPPRPIVNKLKKPRTAVQAKRWGV